MELRELGRSGIKVAPLAFGGNVFGWTVDEETCFRLLDAFVEGGFNLIDTADAYSTWAPGNHGGESETAIGKWLRLGKKRHKVVIATKVGFDVAGHKGLSKRNIAQAVDASLRRLNTDYIDLYQAHYDDQTEPLEETLEAFTELQREGKIRAFGASNYSAERLELALEFSRKNGWPRYECYQPRYNLADRSEYEGALEKICRGQGLGVITHTSLASGFLSGKYRTRTDLADKVRGNRVEAYMNDRCFQILWALRQVAEKSRASCATVALAWLMSKPTVSAAIASATNLDQLQELMAAARLKLDASSLELLEGESAD